MDPVRDISLFWLGDRARDSQSWPVAAAIYREALVRDPENAGLWVQYGHASKETGSVAQAEAAYRQAMCLMPEDHDIRLQLGHLLKLCGDLRGAIKSYREAYALSSGASHDLARELASLRATAPAPGEIQFDNRPVVIDVSDLLRYGSLFPRLSGIQRVQLGIIDALLAEESVGRVLLFTMHDPSGKWRHVSSIQLREISAGLRGESGPDARDETRSEYSADLTTFVWPKGAIYLMLGTAWDDQTHSDALGRLKETASIRVVSFIHDLVPIERPECCVPGLGYRFERWLKDALAVNDAWISNSSFTGERLQAFALSHGLPAPHVTPVSLNTPTLLVRNTGQSAVDLEELKAAVGFDPSQRRFVLAVGTIEPRKNYVELIRSWRAVVAELKSPPILVIVGKVGWRAAPVLRAIAEARAAGIDIRHATRASDRVLDTLYSRCLCLLSLSLMEGWGLPVTEALAHGRVPVLGKHSGGAEAAGEFGWYVDLRDRKNITEQVRSLVSDDGLRTTLEAAIKRHYVSKSWLEIARDCVAAAQRPELA